jgi:predicted amidohydrolase
VPADVSARRWEIECNTAGIAKHASTECVVLLVCPEMYLTGYNIGIDALRELAESSDGTSAHAVAEITRKNSVAIIYGYPEPGGADAIFNSAQPKDTSLGIGSLKAITLSMTTTSVRQSTSNTLIVGMSPSARAASYLASQT